MLQSKYSNLLVLLGDLVVVHQDQVEQVVLQDQVEQVVLRVVREHLVQVAHQELQV